MSSQELRAFAHGVIVGALIVAGVTVAASFMAGVKWQPVHWDWRQ